MHPSLAPSFVGDADVGPGASCGPCGGRAETYSWPFDPTGAISHNLPQDDVTSNILAQTFEPGYALKQPPLYEWMLWAVQRVTGPTLPSFLLLKYGLLTATFAFLYLVAKRSDRQQETEQN